MSSLVSILTPSFGHEAYLPEYFESLLAQTHGETELLYCDDASPDESWPLARSFRERLEKHFRRVVLMRHASNRGLIATLDELVAMARGTFLCILESDDYLRPEKIASNVEYLERHPDHGLVHSDVDFLLGSENRLERDHWRIRGRKIPEGEVFENLLRENFILTCSATLRTDLVRAHADFESYRRRGYRTADYPLFLDLARHARFGYIDRSLAVYRVLPGSISHPQSEVDLLQWRLDYYRVKLDYIRDYGCRQETAVRAATQFHAQLRRFGWLTGSIEDFARGDAWLREHRSSTLDSWSDRLCRTVIRRRPLWRTARWIERLVGARG